jgi:hypothetical protein
MSIGTNRYQQKRSGAASALLVLFVVLIALCPIKRIFFSSPNATSLHQKAKIAEVKQSRDMQQLKEVPSGLCGLSYVTLKQAMSHTPSLELNFIAPTALIAINFLLFRAGLSEIAPIPVPVYLHTQAMPIFIRNQLFRI